MTTFIQLFLVLTAIILMAATIAEKEKDQTGKLIYRKTGGTSRLFLMAFLWIVWYHGIRIHEEGI